MTEAIRLVKRVVALTGCSRREAEQYIEGGWVRVDGVTVVEIDRIEQEFVVEVGGKLIPNGLVLLNHGLRFNHYAMPPIKVSWQSDHRLRFAFKRLSPGQIQPMCEAVGLTVLAMKCLRVGRIPLARMPAGAWRYLAPTERI